MISAAIDNDVLFKAACYGLLEDLLSQVPVDPGNCCVLGSAVFVISRMLVKGGGCANPEGAGQLLDAFFDTAQKLEPTDEELKFAAELELEAQKSAVNLDGGESLLVAIVLVRELDYLITGDKRAVLALSALRELIGPLLALNGKMICLEMLFARLLDTSCDESIRDAVCAEPDVDRALKICFCCGNPSAGCDQWKEGLVSYINALEKAAPGLLAN